MNKILLKATFLGLMCLWFVIAVFLNNSSLENKVTPVLNVINNDRGDRYCRF